MFALLRGNINSTQGAVDFYKRYKEAFGEVTSAEMIEDDEKVKFKLILTNTDNEQLIFEDCVSAGHLTQGGAATIEILNSSGFLVSKQFIKANSSFKLTK